MWISNTATAALMVPICVAVLENLFEHNNEDVEVVGGEKRF